MKIKMLVFFMAVAIAVAGPAQLGAEIIPLDGIANAGWYNDNLTAAHLYIADLDNPGGYYYKWTYSAANPAPLWNSRGVLAADLADGVLLNGTPVNNWHVEAGGDVFNNPSAAIWKSLNFSPGTYTLKLTADSRAYQLNEFLWKNEVTPELWNAYVQIYAVYEDSSTGSFTFGDWQYNKGSESAVLDYYHPFVDLPLSLIQAATLYFYINDYNSVDNGASVTLEFNGTPAPLPGSLILLTSGMAAVFAWRRRSIF